MNEPRITFLDLATMDAGDVDFSKLEALGNFRSFPTTRPSEVVERLAETDVAVVNKIVLGREQMEACSELKMIQLSATGYNNIDLEAARERGIIVCNVSGYSSDGVAQHTIGLLINLATSIHRFAVEADRWSDSPVFSRLDYPATELMGKVLGIAGSGDIGMKVAGVAEALGMRVQFLDREGSGKIGSAARPRVGREAFFETSDAVTLHCPLTEETLRMIDSETLGMMKPSAFLINTGRGDLVDEEALDRALRDGVIAGAGLDVLSQEPPAADNALVKLAVECPDRLIITPHSAWTATESRRRLLDGMVGNIEGWMRGEARNVVSCEL